VTMLLPVRIGPSCGNLHLYYIYVSNLLLAEYLTITDQLAVRGLSVVLSIIDGSTGLALVGSLLLQC